MGTGTVRQRLRAVKEVWGDLPATQQEAFATWVVAELCARSPVRRAVPICVQCGEPMPRYGRRDQQRCSDACRQKGHRDRKRGGPPVVRVCTCSICGQAFEARRSNAYLCSPTCRQQRYRDRKQKERVHAK